MQKIHVNRDRRSLGKFTPEEVTAGLQSGEFQPSDLAWREGMETWQPLGEFTDLPEEGEPISTPPSPGEPVDLFDAEIMPPMTDVEAPLETVPWERSDELGFGAALKQTLKGSLLTPSVTLRGAVNSESLMKPFSYYVLLAAVTGFIALLLDVWLAGIAVDLVSKNPELMKEPQLAKLAETFSAQNSFLVGLTGLAIKVPLMPFYFAGIIHALLMTMGTVRAPFASTFAVCCYAIGSAGVFQLLSCCGMPLVIGFMAVSISLGLAAVHRMPSWQSAMAVVVSLLVGCGLYAGVSMVSAGV